MIDTIQLHTYALRAERELRGNILPFWIQHTVDMERGGFYGGISNDLHVDLEAPKGALLTTRILWAYAAAYRRYQEAEYLVMAQMAYADLIDRFWDHAHGGLYWAVSPTGEPLQPHKQIFVQAYGIYALAEYALATGSRYALDRAIALHRLIEAHASDALHGGYREACAADWQPHQAALDAASASAEKTFNTHLHVLEAYANLLRSWNSPELRTRLAALIDLIASRMIDRDSAHARHFFTNDFTPLPGPLSFGHDIEASWLLLDAAHELGDRALLARVEPLALAMADAVYAQGLGGDGALPYESDWQGNIVQAQREWWPQTEAVVGFLRAYCASGEPHFLEAALRCWEFIEQRLVDRAGGEWFKAVTPEGEPLRDEAKVSFWKCPYHNTRACLEMVARLQQINQSSVLQISRGE
ncbi:N-acyl-D-glucosamine 2-epimerase [Chloroflexia bacterium SDU3-3]|nr:N-acyl-D-glucosamine 2-epimerase [Chloroflexia bacterium SDU3-3]